MSIALRMPVLVLRWKAEDDTKVIKNERMTIDSGRTDSGELHDSLGGRSLG